jgi:hypothetical protein
LKTVVNGPRLKADAQRDIDQRQFGIEQQLLARLDLSLQDGVPGGRMSVAAELGSEVHAGEPRRRRPLSAKVIRRDRWASTWSVTRLSRHF